MWLTEVFDMLTEEQCGLVVPVLYHIWASRNLAVWERALPRPERTWRCAAAAMQSFRQVHHRSLQPVQQPATILDGMNTRPKCFFDAGIKQQTGEATYGIVLISHDGAFVAATNSKLASSLSPLMAEALACKEALSWLRARDVLTVDLLTDCSELRSSILSDSSAILSYIGVTTEQCYPYARRLSGNEVEFVENLSAMHVKPGDILTSVKRQNPENVSITKTIYNACQKFRMMEKAGKTQMQVVMSFLHNNGYVHESRTNIATNELEDLFFVHHKSLEKWRAFPHVLLIDATYKTNRYSMPLVEMTDRYLNFGNHTTNRVESQHANLKKYLESSQSDLETSLDYIDRVIKSQDTSIKSSLEQSKIVIRHRFNTSHFQELRGFVSIHALNLIFNEFARSQVGEFTFENCGCQLRTSCGLPCAHEQVTYFNCKPIALDSIDIFWRKLDLSSSISLTNEDFGVEHELHMFKDQLKKQSRTGKFSILRKFRELIAPSTTSIRESAVQLNVCGRPSSKNKSLIRTLSLRKTQVEPNNIQFQEPARNSCSAASNSGNRHFYHPYILQLPVIFHPFIMQVQDVRYDGNCGFRAVALCLGFKEDEWFKIRSNLIEELESHKMEYTNMFGTQGWYNVYNMLNFFAQDRCAPVEHWMTMPEMGVLIASRYNVILHVLSMAGSTTYLPLRSSPPPWYEHVAIALGYVNNNHYVKVTLTGGYPMPTIAPQWAYFRYDCANAWITPYMNRIESYNEHVRSNCTRKNVILD
ncbi:PREDICTED: uncharacterized protein LOC109155202 [Ipomoea nil]|uniref:uncharacterized protein LOC109155202 n=1 Tax=Ipomoea nil TaxID=35883 RepID=UPI000900A540|nr:PREDICTED: uncharacterized protein LOC109155202 [Ipomoea nil]